jgi:hypothetical protein
VPRRGGAQIADLARVFGFAEHEQILLVARFPDVDVVQSVLLVEEGSKAEAPRTPPQPIAAFGDGILGGEEDRLVVRRPLRR